MPRVSAYAIPNSPRRCSVGGGCIYRTSFDICREPRTNKGNGDAACHRMNNKDLLPKLVPAEHVN